MKFENRNYAFTRTFVEELSRCGLKHVCICPGSRSTPLTIAFAENPSIQSWIHLDERSAGYFALGMAKALGEPVALVCTSGTAAANFLPATVEAFYTGVPLIILTGDRPPELWGWGANQTINQIGIYGSHVKESTTMPVPEITLALLSFVRAQACRTFGMATSNPSGPVHVNFPFREPLEPVRIDSDFPEDIEKSVDEAWTGRQDSNPFFAISTPTDQPKELEIIDLVDELSQIPEGIIVCGPQLSHYLSQDIYELGNVLKYPVLADPLSQIRTQRKNFHVGAYMSGVMDCYDLFLRDPVISQPLSPKVILRFGGFPTSKSLGQFLEKHSSAKQIIIHGDQQWNDPIHAASQVFHINPSEFCRQLTNVMLTERSQIPQEPFFAAWTEINRKTQAVIREQMNECEEMFEGKLFSELQNMLPDGSSLFVGNSMPIRDMDTYFPSTEKNIQIFGNRGASGIDGIVSTALGVASVTEKIVMVLGDISFYHDLNGLLAAKEYKINATIIVLNNDGGGIFSFLPQRESEVVFEKYFGTPHGLNFQNTAKFYGLRYYRTKTWEEFRSAFSKDIKRKGTTIIEIPGNRESNLQLHQTVAKRILSKLRT